METRFVIWTAASF